MVLKKVIEKNPELKGKDLKEIENLKVYKDEFKKENNIKTEFHGNRDFYNIIKGVAIEGAKLNDISEENAIKPIIENYIERNFGGISYEIDIDFSIQIPDKKEEVKILKENILKEKINNNKDSQDTAIKFTSVYLFKKIYNQACTYEEIKLEKLKGVSYQLKEDQMNKYNLNKCINNNINDNNSRYLLLEIKSSLAPLINQIIRI